MKKKYIYILIGVISISLIGLVAIQLYWIDNAVTLKEEEFKRDIKSTLFAVANKLEKIEAINRYEAHQKRTTLFNQRLGAFQKNLSDDSSVTIFDRDGVHYKINEVQPNMKNGGVYQKMIQKTSPNGQTSFQLNVGVSGNKKMSLALDDMLLGLYGENKPRTILEKINKKVLDSLLYSELLHKGIKTKFQYGVFDYDGGEILVDSLSNLNKIRNSAYFTQLFPNDILEQPHFLTLYFPHQKGYLLKTMWVMLLSSIMLLVVIIGAFTFTIQTIFRQKKISEIKNDFISNMTHELKTPISTISLACEALSDPDVSESQGAKNTYVSMISQENKRLGLLVESVLKSALWDKTDLKLKKETFDIHQTIKGVVENIIIQINSKGGTIKLELGALETVIEADKIHITNVIYNLLDNANKYSPENPQIKISTQNIKEGILIEVADNGIGIRKENVNKIFEKFYRVPTGNVHNVKGFGLGLNYVKALVEKHAGEIQVTSDFGKGATFKIYLPFTNNENL